jgi:hypothetical protein
MCSLKIINLIYAAEGSELKSPTRVKNVLQGVKTGFGVHQTSYPMGTGGSFPGKRPPASDEVKNTTSSCSPLHMVTNMNASSRAVQLFQWL